MNKVVLILGIALMIFGSILIINLDYKINFYYIMMWIDIWNAMFRWYPYRTVGLFICLIGLITSIIGYYLNKVNK